MKFGTYHNDPRRIQAKFDSKCAESGREIRKGDWCIYYPSSKQVFHIDSDQARQFESESFDNDVLNCNY